MATTVPRINDQLYFVNKKVIVLRVFVSFQLAEVRYLSSLDTFIVDIHVLQQFADETSSLSIKLLGGVL